MGNTHLSNEPEELEQLLFMPQIHNEVGEVALDHIPRYLFRLASPFSDGDTDETWVRSAAAYHAEDSSKEDIFSNLNAEKRTAIAELLNLHLR